MRLTALRRHPVKAMAGESLETVRVTARGLHGDRRFAVVDANGCFTAGKNTRRFRKHDEVFEFGARTLPAGQVEVYRHDGARGPWLIDDPELATHLSGRMGEPMRVLAEGAVKHFDDAPVSVVGSASLAWFAQHRGFDVDDRRLRANLVVETDQPFIEETWSGVHIGAVGFDVVKRITRCRVVDLPQNGHSTVVPLLKTLGAEREVKLGVYLSPTVLGTLCLGDVVRAD